MNYLKTLFISCISALVLAAGFNWFVDPYAMYWSPLVDGLNQLKPEAGNRSRTSKPYVLSKITPNTVIVGNSRVEMGLNPSNALLKGSAFNSALPGIGYNQQIASALHQIDTNPELKHIILSLDYLDFLYSPSELNTNFTELNTVYKQRQSKSNLHTSSADIAKMLFSLDTIFSSVSTIAKQNSVASSLTPQGFNTAQTFVTTVKHEGKGPLFKQKLGSIVKRIKNKELRHINMQWKTFGPKFAYLETLIKSADAKNVSLTIFINPYHISYLHLLDELGYWDDFILWKTHLAEFFQAQPTGGFTAWDFSGINKYTAEPIGLSEPTAEMQWFWEPAHYKASLGDVMLTSLLTNTKNDALMLDLTLPSAQSQIQLDTQRLKQAKSEWIALKSALGLSTL